MTRTIEVEIDEDGEVHPVDPDTKLPKGRAILSWPDVEVIYPALMSERALSDWLRPEEDAAWESYQPSNDSPVNPHQQGRLSTGS